MNAIMIIIVSACGSIVNGGGTGCGVSVQEIQFSTMERCEKAAQNLFPQGKDSWQPKREIKCVDK